MPPKSLKLAGWSGSRAASAPSQPQIRYGT